MSPYIRRVFWLALGALVGLFFLHLNFYNRTSADFDIKTIDDTYCVIYNLTIAEDLKLVIILL
jgi:hypothetical protein